MLKSVDESPVSPVLVNGVFKSSISVFDRGFMYGDGLFETIRVVNGDPLLWDYHIKRLQFGCKKLHIPVDFNFCDRLRDGLTRVVNEANRNSSNCVVKIVITRGAGGRGYLPPPEVRPTEVILCYPAPEYPESYSVNGIAMCTCQHRLSENGALAGLKHLNRLDQVLASAELDETVSEGLMLDQQGYVVEGTKSNILFFEDGGIVSPDTRLSGVDGIARQYIFDHAATLGLRTRIGKIMPTAIASFKGMAITNSILGIWPVNKLDGISLPINSSVYDIQRMLIEQLKYEYKV